MILLELIKYAFITGLCVFFPVLLAFSMCSGD